MEVIVVAIKRMAIPFPESFIWRKSSPWGSMPGVNTFYLYEWANKKLFSAKHIFCYLVNHRKALFKPYYLYRVNILKFCELFQSKNAHTLKNLCKLIRKINCEVVPPG